MSYWAPGAVALWAIYPELIDEIKSHLFSIHFSDLFLSKKTDLCAEIWNN